MDPAPPADRLAFAERVRLQLLARYPGADVDVEAARFALRLRASGVDLHLPLSGVHSAVVRQPDHAASVIGAFIRSVETRLVPVEPQGGMSPERLVWCVRSRRYLRGVARSDEMLVTEVGADVVGFVAESLPGTVMRGIPRLEWEAAGMADETVRDAAGRNTERRFADVARRVAALDRVPADGWRLSADPLFQGSILLAPSLLRAFVDRVGGDVLIGIPDRALALVSPASEPSAQRFPARVLREWREAMNPVSREVFRTDGERLEVVGRPRRSGDGLMPWLTG